MLADAADENDRCVSLQVPIFLNEYGNFANNPTLNLFVAAGLSAMLDRHEQYRELAAYCRGQADKVIFHDLKTEWLRLAELWLELIPRRRLDNQPVELKRIDS